MELKEQIPKPILFNSWKHHLEFIKEELKTMEVKDEKNFKDFAKQLNIMGNSLSDLYTGSINTSDIVNNIIKEINTQIAFDKNSFKSWIHTENRDYRIITLPDKSTWTLRYGNKEERYIHIHPARYSTHSIRVKSISLKTATLLSLWCKHFEGSVEDIELINKLRINYLKASPLKTISPSRGLGKIIKLFVES